MIKKSTSIVITPILTVLMEFFLTVLDKRSPLAVRENAFTVLVYNIEKARKIPSRKRARRRANVQIHFSDLAANLHNFKKVTLIPYDPHWKIGKLSEIPYRLY